MCVRRKLYKTWCIDKYSVVNIYVVKAIKIFLKHEDIWKQGTANISQIIAANEFNLVSLETRQSLYK